MADNLVFGQRDGARVQPIKSCWAKALDESPSIPRNAHVPLWEMHRDAGSIVTS